MKSLLFALLITLGLSFTAFGQKAGAGTKADPTKPVKDAFERFADGIRTVDAAKVMSSYVKSEDMLIFNNNGSVTRGYETVKSNTEAVYARLKNVTLDITGLRVEMLGKTAAYVTCKWRQSQENNGNFETSSGRMTLVYKLVGKDWKITHRHTSPETPSATAPVFPSERTN